MTTVPAWNRIKTRLQELGYDLTLEEFMNLELIMTMKEEGRCTYYLTSELTLSLSDMIHESDVRYMSTSSDLEDTIVDGLRDTGAIYDGSLTDEHYEDHDSDGISVETIEYKVIIDGEAIYLKHTDITEFLSTLPA